MDDVIELAKQLGQAVARHPHYIALREAEDAAAADPEAKALVEELARQQERLMRLSREQKPVEPEDKRKLADLQKRLMGNEKLKKAQAAQVNFKHLMDTLNRAIYDALEPPAPHQPPPKT